MKPSYRDLPECSQYLASVQELERREAAFALDQALAEDEARQERNQQRQRIIEVIEELQDLLAEQGWHKDGSTIETLTAIKDYLKRDMED